VDAAEENDLGVGFRCLIAEPERIADEICDFLKFPDLIVVCEDDGVTFALQFRDVRRQIQPIVYTCANHSSNIRQIETCSNNRRSPRHSDGGRSSRDAEGEIPGSQELAPPA